VFLGGAKKLKKEKINKCVELGIYKRFPCSLSDLIHHADVTSQCKADVTAADQYFLTDIVYHSVEQVFLRVTEMVGVVGRASSLPARLWPGFDPSVVPYGCSVYCWVSPYSKGFSTPPAVLRFSSPLLKQLFIRPS